MPATEKPVRRFKHTRKGPIVGHVVWESEDGEWFDIELVGEQTLRYASISNRLAGPNPDGDVVRVRSSMVTEVTDA